MLISGTGWTRLLCSYLVIAVLGSVVSSFAQNLSSEDKLPQMYLHGLRLMGQEKYERAIEKFKHLVETRADFSRACDKLVPIYVEKNKLNRAKAYFEKLIAQNPDNPQAYRGLGLVLKEKKDWFGARENFRKSIEILPAQTTGYKNLIDTYQNLGQLNEATSFVKYMITAYPQSAEVYYGLAYLHQIKGQWYAALENLNQALTYNPELLDAHVARAQLLLWLGRFQEVLTVCGTGISIAEKYNDLEFVAEFLNLKAEAYYQLFIDSEAIAHYQRASDIKQQIGDKRGVLRCLMTIGRLYTHKGNYNKALKFYNQALAYSKRMHDKRVEGYIQNHLGFVKQRMNCFPEAERLHSQALRTGKALDVPEIIWEAYAGLALTNERGQNPVEAIQNFQLAIAEIESSNTELSSDYPRMGFLENKYHVYNMFVQLLLALHQNEPSLGYDKQAFLAAEKAKIQRVANIFLQSTPQNMKNKIITPLTTDEIQQNILKDNEALLEYVVGEKRSFIFIIKRDTLDCIPIKFGRESLREMVYKLVKPLYDGIDPLKIRYDLKLAHQAYNILFQPAEDFLEHGDNVIIVADDILYYLPFEALVVELADKKTSHKVRYSEYKAVKYLIRKHPVSYSFSASALAPRSQQQVQLETKDRQLLVLSASSYSNSENSKKPWRSVGWAISSSDFSEEEVKRISKIYRDARVLSKAQANEKNFKELSANYYWLHLAIPGLMNDFRPGISGLALADTDGKSEAEFLSAPEISRTDLPVDLVTLTGCRTIWSRSGSGAGLLSLTWAFTHAGANSVITNLWPVKGPPIVHWVAAFYWRMKYKRLTNVRALREAKLSLIKETVESEDGTKLSYAHPYFWASFVALGNTHVRYKSHTALSPWAIVVITYVIVLSIASLIVRTTVASRQKNPNATKGGAQK